VDRFVTRNPQGFQCLVNLAGFKYKLFLKGYYYLYFFSLFNFSETTGECAISEVSSSASITEATSPTGSATTSPLAHGECIKEEDELEKAESPSADNSIHLPPVRFIT